MQPLVPLVFHNLPSLYPPSFRRNDFLYKIIVQERMDLMKSWAGIEEEKAGRSVCCVMQSVRVLVMCCGIVLHTLVLEVPSCWS